MFRLVIAEPDQASEIALTLHQSGREANHNALVALLAAQKATFEKEGAHDISSTGEAHAEVKAQDGSEVIETEGNETFPTEDIATSHVVETEKRAPKMKGDAIATPEQIQLRAYFIAERRKNSGIAGDENGDWAQAERELRAEGNLLQEVH